MNFFTELTCKTVAMLNVTVHICYCNCFVTFDNLKNKIMIYSWKHESEPKQKKQS